MPARAVKNSVLRSLLSLSDPLTCFVFIRAWVRHGETIGAASRCDGFPAASSTTSGTMSFVWWRSLTTDRGPTTGWAERNRTQGETG